MLSQPRPQALSAFKMAGHWHKAGHVSPKILKILIIQNGGKVAAVEETIPRQEQKMADKTDMSSLQTTNPDFFYTYARGRCYDIG